MCDSATNQIKIMVATGSSHFAAQSSMDLHEFTLVWSREATPGAGDAKLSLFPLFPDDKLCPFLPLLNMQMVRFGALLDMTRRSYCARKGSWIEPLRWHRCPARPSGILGPTLSRCCVLVLVLCLRSCLVGDRLYNDLIRKRLYRI